MVPGKQSETSRSPVRPLFNRVAVLRTEHGLSRRDLASRVGVNYQTIGYIERGEYSPSLDLAFRLADVFELPVEAIFSRRPLRPMSQQLFSRQADSDPQRAGSKQ
jgi:DNA-binding XRE family transcriptional regulator